MKQVLQNLRTGKTEVADVPSPAPSKNKLLIRTCKTLISFGTERMLVDFSKAGFINKARQQPDKVRMVLDKIRVDGIQPTLEAVLNKLDQPMPLGYCNVGIVEDVGLEIFGFRLGDRVVSNGKHAEVVSAPQNLCAKIPNNVSDDEASFTVLGAIALQGVRLSKPTLGETFVVTGLGLLGLLTVQLLKAHGCRVLGIDFDEDKIKLAKSFGAEVVNLSAGEDPIKSADLYSRGRGVDAVIITASTKSDEPIHQAALMCRKRGRVILVGVTGLHLSRDDFFKKELTFQVSASYGPGRYDPNYEEKGQDYPFAFVRWTEQRNFEAILDMMAEKSLNVAPLITHRFKVCEAEEAYRLFDTQNKSLGILLEYSNSDINLKSDRTLNLKKEPEDFNGSNVNETSYSFIGAGNYASSVLIPAFKKNNAHLRVIASSSGLTSFHSGRKYGFDIITSDSDLVIKDPLTKAIIISTQHDSHANFIIKSLTENKHVFVEKPLCLNLHELADIEKAFNKTSKPGVIGSILMVGFNRRFAPQIRMIKQLLDSEKGPKSFVMVINAGAIPLDHWTQDIYVGGGRVIGEACHFIDLLRFLADCPIKKWTKSAMTSQANDTLTITLTFDDGSIGSINYFANGSKSFPKETLDIFCNGKILSLDNYRKLHGYGWSNFKKMNLWRQDKGQLECVKAFMNSVQSNREAPISFNEIIEIAKITIEIANA
jgi:threonine dehydrogenase-like Zn-dependent dehydrogenase/predicted dehydrogenase